MAAPLELEAKVTVTELNNLLRQLETGGREAARSINEALGGKVTKTLVLETVTDDSGARRLIAVEKERLSAVDKIAQAQAKAAKINANSVTSLRQQVNEARQARDATAKYEQGINGISRQLRTINPLWQAQSEQVRRLERQLRAVDGSGFWERIKGDLGLGGIISFSNGLEQIVQGFQAISIIIGQVTASVNGLINALANLQQFELAFRAIGAGGAGALTSLQESTRIANNLGVNLGTVREGFRQLSPVVLKSGGSISDVSGIVESLSSRFAAFGISGDRARRVTNGIIQAFAKGKLQAEELTQQISEADPAFKTDFAGALGVSVQALEELVKNGEITSEVLIKTIPQLSKSSLLYGKLGTSATEAANRIGEGGVTIDQVRAKIENINQLSLESFAKTAEPAIKAFIQLAAVVADLTSEFINSQAGKALTTVFAGIIKAASGLAQALGNLVTGVLTVIDPFARLVNLLLKIPGLAEAAAIAIGAKLVVSLINLKNSFIAAAAANGLFNNGLLKTVADVFGFSNAAGGLGRGAAGAAANLNRLNKSAATLGKAQEFASGKVKTLSDRLANLKAQRTALEAGAKNIFADPQKLSFLNNQIQATSESLNKYSGVASRAGQKLGAVTSSIDAVSTAAIASQGGFAALGAGIKSAFTAAGVFIKDLVAKLALINPKVAVVIGALIALGVAVKAYGDATADSNAQIEENKATLQAYDEAIKNISSTEIEPPKISRFRAAFEELGLAIAGFTRNIKAAYDTLVGATQVFAGAVEQQLKRLPPALRTVAQQVLTELSGPFGKLLQILGFLGQEVDASSIKFRKFANSSSIAFDGIEDQIAKIRELTNALREQDQEAGSNSGKKNAVVQQYLEASKQVKATRDEFNRIQKQIGEFEKKQEEGQLSPEDAKQLEELKRRAAELKGPLEEAQRAFTELGKEIGAVSNKELKEALGAMGALGERAKQLEGDLQIAVGGTKEFRVAAALLAATQLGVKNLQDAAKDPIQLLQGIDEAEVQKLQEVSDLQKELAEAEAKPLVDSEEVTELRLKIAQAEVDLENLDKLETQIKIDRDKKAQKELREVQIATQETISKLNELQKERDLTQVQLTTTVDQPKLREARSQFVEFRSDINKLLEDSAIIDLKLGDPDLGETERRQLLGQQAALAKTLSNTAASTTASLKDAAATLRRELLASQASLAEIGIQAREKGLSLGSAGTSAGAASLALQAGALREIDAQLQRIAQERGLTLTFTGTADQITRAKIETLNFYQNLEKTERQARDLSTGVEEVDKFLAAIKESGLQATFDLLAESASSLAGATETGAGNTENMATSLANAATQADNIRNAILSLDGLNINVKINSVPGLWTGGTAMAGTQYRVNELGQEGFLSSTGRLGPINKPKNALWRAPSTGTVIPAHLWSQLDVPSGGIGGIRKPPGMTATRGGLQRLAGAIQNALSKRDPARDAALGELSAVQAQQAIQIGKLSRAVDRFADKKWDVHVGVKSTGNAAYLEMLNHRL